MRYIEYRVHIKHDADSDDVKRAAEVLHDEITDAVSDPLSPDVFSQDVTYEIVGEDDTQLKLDFEKEVQ